ncbi:hypothetical protein Anapl_11878 [Anas platyrhynchos]|uniref:Uncharacterized protein n=1 Tax=Anas platyrhynchos TaxID=8839 RepID=R0LCG5_ANAPL|nr:hypothetical protein Anapl_11878 [Anas platyrhynchos]
MNFRLPTTKTPCHLLQHTPTFLPASLGQWRPPLQGTQPDCTKHFSSPCSDSAHQWSCCAQQLPSFGTEAKPLEKEARLEPAKGLTLNGNVLALCGSFGFCRSAPGAILSPDPRNKRSRGEGIVSAALESSSLLLQLAAQKAPSCQDRILIGFSGNTGCCQGCREPHLIGNTGRARLAPHEGLEQINK